MFQLSLFVIMLLYLVYKYQTYVGRKLFGKFMFLRYNQKSFLPNNQKSS